ncbi:MAG: class I SAM-dependent methyltransferase [Asgard group archaeon]|nr:class I SAM-dependent methyltransferase [Asgard group archaeon]
MKEQVVYRKLAKYYDKIYHWKDYKKEVEDLNKIITKFKKSKGNNLLDVGCGTGSHIQFFKDDFNCTGLDLNNNILDIAREKLPNVEFIHCDMTEMNLRRKYDIIVCLFSSIGYLLTEEKLMKAIENFNKLLNSGGVVIIEPWLTLDIFREGSVHMTVYDGEDLKIARVNTNQLKNDIISYFEMHYLIAEQNKAILHIVDKHELAMFSHELIMDFMKKSGLTTTKLTEDLYTSRGLLIGVKD